MAQTAEISTESNAVAPPDSLYVVSWINIADPMAKRPPVPDGIILKSL